MKPRFPRFTVVAFALLFAAPVAAQTAEQSDAKATPPAAQTDTKASPPQPAPKGIPGWARVSFYANGSSTTPTGGGDSTSFSELITSITVQAPVPVGGGVDYGLDLRFAGYPTSDRTNRVSIYNAFVGARTANGTFAFKAGQLWLNDLGGLGALGGAVAEKVQRTPGSDMQWRVGAFGGWEPQILQAGFVSGVQKFGGYVAYEATRKPRRHVLGYVNVRDNGFTERSVITTTNFIPFNDNVFVYQAAEYDLAGPAGLGSGGLSYFFTNARIRSGRRVELQGTYHRGRSIDARGITLDQLNGRPIDAKSLDGYRFESAGGRVTVEVVRNVRLFAGYSQDRNNRDDSASGRLQAGVWANDLAGTGLDVNVSDSRTIQQGGGVTYDSWYVSVGRSVVPRVYLTGEFSSSLSVLRFLGSQSFTILNRPRTRRYATSAIINVYRPASLLFTFERVEDASFSEQRVMSGLTYRF